MSLHNLYATIVDKASIPGTTMSAVGTVQHVTNGLMVDQVVDVTFSDGSNTAIQLPLTTQVGDYRVINNKTANALVIWPPSVGFIDGSAGSRALDPGISSIYFTSAANIWHSVILSPI